MAKRSKSQAKRGSGGIPAWLFLVIGLLIGVIIAGIYFLRVGLGPSSGEVPTPDPQAQAPGPRSDEPVAQEPERSKPTFDFYTVLPEKEVVIPDSELSAQAQAESRRPPPSPDQPAPPASSERFVLQAGAFRSLSDAEALKARIALTGQIARVESAEINGQTVYRVRLGPYPSASSLDSAKRALADNGLEAVAIRAR